MNIDFLSKAIAPLAAVAALSMAAPAAAAVFFGNGDSLNITAGFKAPTPTGLLRFQKTNNAYANVGSYGIIGVLSGSASTGAFDAFESNGAITAGYEILSVDFNNSDTYLGFDFLKLNNGVDAIKFVITDSVAKYYVPNSPFTVVGVKGLFRSANDQVLGEGNLTGQFIGGTNGSFSGSLTVTKAEPVPEPSALLGIGLMVGAVYVIRRRQVAIA